jgi:hypothetical protein
MDWGLAKALAQKDEGGRMKVNQRRHLLVHPSSFIPHPSQRPAT